MTTTQGFLLVFTIAVVVASIAIFAPRKSFILDSNMFGYADYERWMRHMVRMFPDGGIAIIDMEGVIIECSVEFAKMAFAAGSAECIGRNIDSFHADIHSAKLMRENLRQDMPPTPMVFKGITGETQTVSLSMFDLKGIWLVRVVRYV